MLIPASLFSQENDSKVSRKELRKERPTYIGINVGGSSSSLRDFATSPLIYKGIQKHIGISRQKFNLRRESSIGVSYQFGKYNNTFNEQVSSSETKTMSLHYSQLYQINKSNTGSYNIKAGGMLNVTGNMRTNAGLQNNASGIEFIPTLFGSFKITKDISRKADKEKKFLFIKYKLKQKIRNLGFNLNIGLINSSFRNGYVYSGQSAVLNTPKLLDDYQFKLFSGFRMSSALDYSIHLRNKNIVQLSYLWDAYKTGGDLDKFEMAHHTIKFTFLFNTNNK
jgi:hypothetical protein